jgi:transcription elongation factor SPT4
MIAVTDPKTSWVARWQRVDRYVPGMYAVQVIGTLSKAWVAELAEAGMRYVPRDGSRDDEEGGADDL